jgi:hypothetical protein
VGRPRRSYHQTGGRPPHHRDARVSCIVCVEDDGASGGLAARVVCVTLVLNLRNRSYNRRGFLFASLFGKFFQSRAAHSSPYALLALSLPGCQNGYMDHTTTTPRVSEWLRGPYHHSWLARGVALLSKNHSSSGTPTGALLIQGLFFGHPPGCHLVRGPYWLSPIGVVRRLFTPRRPAWWWAVPTRRASRTEARPVCSSFRFRARRPP